MHGWDQDCLVGRISGNKWVFLCLIWVREGSDYFSHDVWHIQYKQILEIWKKVAVFMTGIHVHVYLYLMAKFELSLISQLYKWCQKKKNIHVYATWYLKINLCTYTADMPLWLLMLH